MTEAPGLSREDVRQQLETLCAPRAPRSAPLFAFYGRGEEDAVEVDGAGRSLTADAKRARPQGADAADSMRRTRALRSSCRGRARSPSTWQADSRRNGKVQRIGRGKRGCSGCLVQLRLEEGVLQSPLADYLLTKAARDQYATNLRRAHGGIDVGGVAQARVAPRSARWLGTRTCCLRGVRSMIRGSAFVAAMRGAPEVREALLEHLEQRLGAAGARRLAAPGREGAGRAVLEWAILFEALIERPEIEVRTWLKTTASRDLDIDAALVEQVDATRASCVEWPPIVGAKHGPDVHAQCPDGCRSTRGSSRGETSAGP